VNESTLAKRYATALADLAEEQNILDVVGNDLQLLNELFKNDPPLHTTLTSPATEQNRQQQILDIIQEKAAFSTLSSNFLNVLIRKRRMPLITMIIGAFNRILETRSGRIAVQVRTPMELTESHFSNLTEALNKVTNKTVDLDVQLEPELLGGMVVRIGSVMMDYSVRSQLSSLKAHMMKG
jgi:F-type H+-transporting ATPase subunit delta